MSRFWPQTRVREKPPRGTATVVNNSFHTHTKSEPAVLWVSAYTLMWCHSMNLELWQCIILMNSLHSPNIFGERKRRKGEKGTPKYHSTIHDAPKWCLRLNHWPPHDSTPQWVECTVRFALYPLVPETAALKGTQHTRKINKGHFKQFIQQILIAVNTEAAKPYSEA